LKIKKYITRKFLFRLGLFLALLTGAWLFDHFHQGTNMEVTAAPVSGTTTTYPGFYCTPQAAVTFKAPVQKSIHSRLLQEKMNRIIMEHWNARLLFLRKAEALNPSHPRTMARNLVAFRYHFLHFPDDQPPL
jgi:hypothetical protein